MKPVEGFVDRAVGATDYDGCRNAEAAYNMDHSISLSRVEIESLIKVMNSMVVWN